MDEHEQRPGNVTVTAFSEPGLVREQNEDSAVVGPWTLCGTVTEVPQSLTFPLGAPLVVAVADGVGGQPGGEVASALTVHNLASAAPRLGTPESVSDTLEVCNDAVYAAGARDSSLRAMGTTVAGAVVLPDSLLVFNVGDSRVLELSEDGLRQISVDDSPPLPEGMRTTPVITQALGGAPRHIPVTPHVTTLTRAPGARYLVCTDGLSDPVPPEDLEQLLTTHRDPAKAVVQLDEAARAAGAPDNITLALITFDD